MSYPHIPAPHNPSLYTPTHPNKRAGVAEAHAQEERDTALAHLCSSKSIHMIAKKPCASAVMNFFACFLCHKKT